MRARPIPVRSRRRARSISIRALRSGTSFLEWRGYSMAMRGVPSRRCGTASRSIRTTRRMSRGTSCLPTPNCLAMRQTRRLKARTGRSPYVPVFGPTFEVLRCCAMALGRLDDARRWAKRMKEVDNPESHFVAPIKANQPKYDKRIVRLLQGQACEPTMSAYGPNAKCHGVRHNVAVGVKAD